MAKGKTTVNGKGNGSQAQNKRPAQNGKAAPRVVKSAGSQRPKVGAKANVVKARAVTVSTKAKPATNRVTNRPVLKAAANNRPAKQVTIKQQPAGNGKAPRQKIVLQESQRKPTKPVQNTNKQSVNRNVPVNNSRNTSRPNSAASVPKSVVNSSRNNNNNSNNSAPANQSELSRALQTANSIAITRSHPKQAEVVELLRTHEKGWVDDRKFITLLKSLAF